MSMITSTITARSRPGFKWTPFLRLIQLNILWWRAAAAAAAAQVFKATAPVPIPVVVVAALAGSLPVQPRSHQEAVNLLPLATVEGNIPPAAIALLLVLQLLSAAARGLHITHPIILASAVAAAAARLRILPLAMVHLDKVTMAAGLLAAAAARGQSDKMAALAAHSGAPGGAGGAHSSPGRPGGVGGG